MRPVEGLETIIYLVLISNHQVYSIEAQIVMLLVGPVLNLVFVTNEYLEVLNSVRLVVDYNRTCYVSTVP